MAKPYRFWEHKPLDHLSRDEWEALCDGCGKCCLHKLLDEETEEVYLTSVACRYLDPQHVSCRVYAERQSRVPECIVLSPDNLSVLAWMPETCAYRLVHEGQPLAEWHPLLGGSVHASHVSVQHKVISEDQVPEADLENYIICKIN